MPADLHSTKPVEETGGETNPATPAVIPQAQSTTPAVVENPDVTQGKTFTQAEVNALLGNVREEGRTRATSALLTDLGYDDPAKAKADLAAWKAHQEGQLTELQKAQLDLEKLQGVNDSLTAKDAQIETLTKIVHAQLEARMKDLAIPDYVLPLLKTMSEPEQLAYLSEHGADFIEKPKVTPNTNAGSKGSGGENGQSNKKRIAHRYNIK
jgi:hypothetical protein